MKKTNKKPPTNKSKLSQTWSNANKKLVAVVAILFVAGIGYAFISLSRAETVIDVRNYGVTANDNIDDTANLLKAFNASLDPISKLSIATVKIPAGTYNVSSLTLPANLKIKGDGVGSWLNGKVLLNRNNLIEDMSIGMTGTPTSLVASYKNSSGQWVVVDNLVMNRVTFKGGGGTGQAVLRIDTNQSLTNSQLNDCVIETNPDGIGNGISIVDNGVLNSTLNNVVFNRLHIMPQPRMGFEMIGRSYAGTRTTDYYNIKIIDSTIEAVGAESISFDGPGRDLLVQGTHFKGSNTTTTYSWHQALEFNGSKTAKAIANTFDRQRGTWLNLHCTNCTFENNYFDSRVDTIGQTVSNDVQAWGGECDGCIFKNNQVIKDVGGGFFYFAGSTNNNFTGNVFWDSRNPTTHCSYLKTSSTGNTMSGNKFYYKYQYYNNNNPCISVEAGSALVVTDNSYFSPTTTPDLNPPTVAATTVTPSTSPTTTSAPTTTPTPTPVATPIATVTIKPTTTPVPTVTATPTPTPTPVKKGWLCRYFNIGCKK